MPYGLPDKTIKSLKAVIAAFPEVEEAVIFGSRATGTHKPGSDIDMALKGKKINQKHLGRIETEIDALMLPFKVDLLRYDDVEHVKLRAHIDQEGAIFHKSIKIGDVCIVIAGQSPDSKFYNTEGKGLPFYQGKKDFGDRYISPAKVWTTFVTKKAEPNDILMSVRAPVGPVNFCNQTICIGRGLAAIRAKAEIDHNFLFYYLSSIQNQIKGNDGAVFASINKTQIASISLPLPQIKEQRRIVSVLDTVLADLAHAKANAEKNLTKAQELFEAELNEVFEHRSIGWKKNRLSDISTNALGKMLDKNKNKGVLRPYLRNFNVRWFYFDLSDVQKMRFLDEESEKYTARNGDVLICEGGYPGRAAIWSEDYPIHFQKAIHRVRFNRPLYNKWFVYFLYQQDASGKLKNHFTGTGIQHFTGKALNQVLLPTPPDNELENLISMFDTLSVHSNDLKAVYTKKRSLCDELKQSLLHQAFNGKL